MAGRYIQGAPLLGPGSWQQRVVGAGYKAVCGDATAWGDGVVPVPSGAPAAGPRAAARRAWQGGARARGCRRAELRGAPVCACTEQSPAPPPLPPAAAHLEGALQLTIEGAYHSPLGADEDGRSLESVQESSDDGEAAVVAAVEAGGASGGAAPRLWYGSHSLIDEWVHVITGVPAGLPAKQRM